MKINIEIKNCRTGYTWWEDYEVEGSDPQAKAQEIISIWNDGLRPHEDRREILQVQVLDDRKDSSEHKWEKSSQTRIDRGLVYDIYRCTVCRITGRRYGLGQLIQPDKQFRAKKYLDCRNAKKIFDERANAAG